MSNQISELPTPKDFGLHFDYSVWTANSEITLCNVPWGNDYRDVVFFENDAALDNYLAGVAGPTTQVNKLTYLAPNRPIRINLPINMVSQFNYIRVYNPAQPLKQHETPRAFYYFVTAVDYVAPNTTQINVQLDVWQTYSRRVKFGNSYIERGHIGIANSKQFQNHGRDYLTVPEGLDVGNEYQIKAATKTPIAKVRGAGTAEDGTIGVVVISTTDLIADPGDVDDPKLRTSTGDRYGQLPHGASIWYFDSVTDFNTYMLERQNRPWVTQGIISVTAVPQVQNKNVLRWYDYVNNPLVSVTEKPPKYAIGYFATPNARERSTPTLRANFRDALAPGGRYQHLHKFKTFPYSVVEITTMSGNPIIIKPETVHHDDLIAEIVSWVAPPNPRVTVSPLGVNGSVGTEGARETSEWLNMSTGILNLPTFSVVNNGYLNYMASNSGAIAYQHSQADWSQQKALMGNQLAFDQSTFGLHTSGRMTEISNQTMQQQTEISNRLASDTAALNAVAAIGTGAVGGAVAGPAGMAGGALSGAASAVTGAISTGLQNDARTASTAASTRAATQSNNVGAANTRYVRDTNRDYADFAARGDYQSQIGAINARTQDAKLTQPTTAGQVGGDAMNLTYFGWNVYTRLKGLYPAAIRMIGEYWLRYGYAVQQFAQMPDDFQVMTKFTYWKLTETYIRSATCPETFKQALRGIFEKGVTVWNNANDIGRIDIADNQPKNGITLP